MHIWHITKTKLKENVKLRKQDNKHKQQARLFQQNSYLNLKYTLNLEKGYENKYKIK